MLKGYIGGLDSDSLPFTITDTQDIILNAPNDPTLRWKRTVISKEIINGQLYDGRFIKFFGCKYNGYTLSAQGYVYSEPGNKPDELIDFSHIMFTGKAIDNLSGGVFEGFECDELEQYEKRMPGITPRPWDEINRFYPSEIANRKCAIEKDFDAQITAFCANMSNTQARKVLRYAKNMLDTLEKVDFNLEEQFNNTLRKFSSIIKPFQLRAAERMGIELSDKANLGAIFAECRNKIGHGHPEPLESIHVYVFVLGRCLTYIMILESAHIDNDRIASIFNKLFR